CRPAGFVEVPRVGVRVHVGLPMAHSTSATTTTTTTATTTTAATTTTPATQTQSRAGV
ncbi:MAG: hypothetical protein MHM6MM_005723, partial [Cercozoa sp. M6MM]